MDPQNPFIERRKTVRFQETFPVLFENRKINAYTFALEQGSGGVRVFWDRQLDVGGSYELAIGLKDGLARIPLKVKVAWERPSGKQFEIGFAFRDIATSEREKLETFLLILKDKAVVGGQGEPAHEKRKHERAFRLLPLTITTVQMPVQSYSGLVVEISLGGARFVTNRLFSEGTLVSLEIRFSPQEETVFNGKIVWGHEIKPDIFLFNPNPFVHAVVFEAYASEALKRLQGCVSEYYAVKELNLVETFLEIMKKGEG